MIIVSGRIHVAPGRRDNFVASSRVAMVAARKAPGCRDFVVAADPLDPDRVNVYEEWETDSELDAFREDGPAQELAVDIVHTDVSRHRISASGPA
jgi:quinol monooxygenase YgiN